MVIEQNAGELIPELERYQLPLSPPASQVRRRRRGGSAHRRRHAVLQSYLIGYMLCLGMTLGCLALGMVHQLSGGAWGVVLRRPIGAAARVLPVLTLLFIPDPCRDAPSVHLDA